MNIATQFKNLSEIDTTKTSWKVTFGHVRYEKGGTCGPRVQRDFQLVAIYEGEVMIRIDGQEHGLGAAQIALLKPGGVEFFQFSHIERTRHSWCSVAPDILPEELRTRLLAAPFSERLSARMSSLIELGLGTPSSSSSSSPERVNPWINAVGIACLEAYLMEAELGLEPTLPPAILQARTIIETRFAEPLSLEALAKAVFTSPNHLVRLFRKHLGTTPGRVLWKVRVRQGTRLLSDTGLTVSEIAYRTGFQNPFHFSRMVKQETGRSPREFRNQRWNPTPPVTTVDESGTTTLSEGRKK